MLRARPAGILLELLLSLALFVAGATAIVATVRGSTDGVQRAVARARAEDLACSRLIELDAGLVSRDELRGSAVSVLGTDFTVSIQIEPTATPELVRAVATVREAFDVDGRVIVERERLIRLRAEESN